MGDHPHSSKAFAPRSGGSNCCVPLCRNYSFRAGSEKVTFHRFPDESDDRYKIWLQRVRRDPSWKPSSSTLVCSGHFVEDDFKQCKSIRKLKTIQDGRSVIPSDFSCLPANVQPADTGTLARREPTDRSEAAVPTRTSTKRTFVEAGIQTAVTEADVKEMERKIQSLQMQLRSINALNAALEKQMADQRVYHKDRIREKDVRIMEELRRLQEATETVKELKAKLEDQEFRVEKFSKNDSAIQKLTGFPSYRMLHGLFKTVFGGDDLGFLDTLDIRNDRADGSYPDRSRRGGTEQGLDYFNQFFLTMVKLKTGMTEDVLAAIFGIKHSSVSRYYNCWIRVMDERMKAVFREFPYSGMPALPLPPKVSEIYEKISMIIDSFEIKIQRPRNPDAGRKCYSNYKKAHTIKSLIGVESDGNVAFLSHIYQGSISDPALVKASGLFQKLSVDDVVLADRGFQMKGYAAMFGVKWIVPPSVRRDIGMSPEDLRSTCEIARARITVERAIGRAKTFRQLEGPLSITDLQRVDIELRVIFSLCKFLPSLIKETDVAAAEYCDWGEERYADEMEPDEFSDSTAWDAEIDWDTLAVEGFSLEELLSAES